MGKLIQLTKEQLNKKEVKTYSEKAKIISFEDYALKRYVEESTLNMAYDINELLQSYDDKKYIKIYEYFHIEEIPECIEELLNLLNDATCDFDNLTDIDILAAKNFSNWFWKKYEKNSRIKKMAKKNMQENPTGILALGEIKVMI